MSKYFSRYKDIPEHVINFARKMRVNPTVQEQKVWKLLSGKKFHGLKFRRQFPIDRYIVDFYFHPARLVIEIDGEIHSKTKEYDRNREAFLQGLGYQIIRFSNSQIDTAIEQVFHTIEEILNLPPAGERRGVKKNDLHTRLPDAILKKDQDHE